MQMCQQGKEEVGKRPAGAEGERLEVQTLEELSEAGPVFGNEGKVHSSGN